jgi:hypothetical protein
MNTEVFQMKLIQYLNWALTIAHTPTLAETQNMKDPLN